MSAILSFASLALAAAPLAARAQDPQGRAEQLEKMGDLAGAARAVEAQLVNDPNDVRSLVRAGLLWARADAYEPAERHLSKAAGLDPKNRDVWLALGEARCRGQQYHPAIEAFERAGQLGDGDGKAKNGVGSALFSLGNRAEAKILFEKAAAQNAGLPGPRHMLGRIALDDGDLPAAIRWFDECLRLDPNDPETLFRKGVALRRAGENDAAAAAFRAALTQDPIHLGARLNLGQLLLALGNEAEGRREIETHGRIARGQQRLTFATASLRLDPSSAASRVGVGEALLELGAAAEALVQFREAIRSKRPPASAYLGAARACAALGEEKAKNTYAGKAVELLEANPKSDPKDLEAARALLSARGSESRASK